MKETCTDRFPIQVIWQHIYSRSHTYCEILIAIEQSIGGGAAWKLSVVRIKQGKSWVGRESVRLVAKSCVTRRRNRES